MKSEMIWYIAGYVRLIFEVLAILCFSNTLAGEDRIKTRSLLLVGSGVGTITALYDYLAWYFVPIVALALCILSLKLLSSVKLWELMGNLICGAAAVFLLELAAQWILMPFGKDRQWNVAYDLIMSGLLIAGIAVVFTLYGKSSASQVRRQTLLAHKKVILLLSISLIVPVVMLANVFLTESILFLDGYHMIPFLAALYFVMNLFLIRYFMDSSHKENEICAMREYGAYLSEIIEELNKKEHEHKNHLNTIISIAELNGPQCREQIIQYAEGLSAQRESQPNGESIVSDNSIMAAWLFKMSRTARLRGIRLDYYVAKPFPIYRMSEQDLMEILANLVNNALEAVDSMPTEKKFVSICIEEVSIKVSNCVEVGFHKSVLKRQKSGFSTKGRGRGYGMSNIRDIIKKYGFTMETYLESDLLTIEVCTGELLH